MVFLAGEQLAINAYQHSAKEKILATANSFLPSRVASADWRSFSWAPEYGPRIYLSCYQLKYYREENNCKMPMWQGGELGVY